MKRKSLSLLLALAMVFSLAIPVSAAEAADTQIVILHTNDVHCGIDQTTDEETGAVTNIGYAGVAAYKAEMEAQYGADNVILVDGGDAIQGGPIGTLSKGSYIVDIMNQVGYDRSSRRCWSRTPAPPGSAGRRSWRCRRRDRRCRSAGGRRPGRR